MKAKRYGGIALLVIWILEAPTAAAPATTRPSQLELGPEYVDGSFGFSLRPPIGGETRRQKRMTGVSDVEIVEFANPAESWSLAVRFVATTEPLDTETIVDGVTAKLIAGYENVEVLRGDEVRIDSREGVRYAASFVSKNFPWLRQQAIVRTKPNEYFTLVFVTALEDRVWAEAIFEKVVESFRILRTQAMSRRIEEALERGRLLLLSVGDGSVTLSRKIVPESYLRFIIGGKPIGAVQISERSVTQNGRIGVQIYEVGWLFREDGSITNMQHDMYLTDDLAFEQWENRVYTLTPAGVEPRQLIFQLENGLRQDRKLIAAFMPRPNATELQDRVFDVEPTYASAAWHAMLPRLIDLRRRELYAFSTYDVERRGMVLRTVEVLGPDQVTIAGRMMQAFKLQSSEGLLPPMTDIYVDSHGRILRVVAGELEMVAASKQDVLQEFGKRITEAEATMKKYPVRRPAPARREQPPPAAPGAARAPSNPRGAVR